MSCLISLWSLWDENMGYDQGKEIILILLNF